MADECCGGAKSQSGRQEAVRAAYAEVAKGEASCCQSQGVPVAVAAQRLGYDVADIALLPEAANLGVGCGNPTAIAALKPGETVLDLGCGGGIDCFLAARQVGPDGRVIGIDMTEEMLDRARANARTLGLETVEFHEAAIESLPVAEASVDVILSNCVINLSDDKPAVFAEAFRVLRPGGRLSISDTVALKPLPDHLTTDAMVACCIGGAPLLDDLRAWIAAAGFADVEVTVDPDSRAVVADWAPGSGAEDYVASAVITAVKPGPARCCG